MKRIKPGWPNLVNNAHFSTPADPLAKHGRDLRDGLFDHFSRTHLTGKAIGLLRIKPILQTWGRTLRGRAPSLSIEITRECPLRCPGCYAYEDAHLGTTNLRSLSDFKGPELIARILAVMDQYKPLHLSIVGATRSFDIASLTSCCRNC